VDDDENDGGNLPEPTKVSCFDAFPPLEEDEGAGIIMRDAITEYREGSTGAAFRDAFGSNNEDEDGGCFLWLWCVTL
jgi:hypothetical protein